jgi:ABC-2 type transport system ATP-binding protein
MIEVQGFHKVYRDTPAVTDLSFQLQPGEILGLVGPNGAGKTTTLRAIAGIIPITYGAIHVAGHDIARDPVAAKQQLASVPDDPNLFEALTVWEHLRFVGRVYGVADIDAKAAALLEQFELTEKRHVLAQELSRGMRQKTAICCAYLHDPKVILFDEPHTGLDPRGIRTIKTSISERAAAGAAIVVSSHLLEMVEDLCTHLLILHRGRKVFAGPIEEARRIVGDLGVDATLEEVFFRVTEGPESRTEITSP